MHAPGRLGSKAKSGVGKLGVAVISMLPRIRGARKAQNDDNLKLPNKEINAHACTTLFTGWKASQRTASTIGTVNRPVLAHHDAIDHGRALRCCKAHGCRDQSVT